LTRKIRTKRRRTRTSF